MGRVEDDCLLGLWDGKCGLQSYEGSVEAQVCGVVL